MQTTNIAPMFPNTANSTSTAMVNIYSIDTNDNTPVFNDTNSGDFVITIIENIPPMTQFAKINASDADISAQFGTPSIR